VDAVELLKRHGIAEDNDLSSSSESESSSYSDDEPRRLRGAFKFTPQEIYNQLRGDEDPKAKGWNNNFLKTEVDTPQGKLSFIAALAVKRMVYQRALAKVRKDRNPP